MTSKAAKSMVKRGTFSFDGGVTHVVDELTGTPAESFETTARRYAALPSARQALANRCKAFINFNLTPFYRGYDFDKWNRQIRLPMPAQPTLCIEDDRWRADHHAVPARKVASVTSAKAG